MARDTDPDNISKTDKTNEKISRRNFLKKAGLGTLGLGALMSPVSALNVKSNDFSIYTSSNNTEALTVDSNQNVNIQNGNLDLNQNQAQGLVLEQVNGDPSNPATGQIWYDTTQD